MGFQDTIFRFTDFGTYFEEPPFVYSFPEIRMVGSSAAEVPGELEEPGASDAWVGTVGVMAGGGAAMVGAAKESGVCVALVPPQLARCAWVCLSAGAICVPKNGERTSAQ